MVNITILENISRTETENDRHVCNVWTHITLTIYKKSIGYSKLSFYHSTVLNFRFTCLWMWKFTGWSKFVYILLLKFVNFLNVFFELYFFTKDMWYFNVSGFSFSTVSRIEYSFDFWNSCVGNTFEALQIFY